MSSRSASSRLRHLVGAALVVVVASAATACGDFQLVEFTRATTTTEAVDPADTVDDPVIDGESGETPVTVHICPVRHLVEPGESVSSIASRCGVTVAQILEMNGIADANAIVAGQQIVIPDPDAPVPPPWQQDPSGPGD